MGFFLRQKTKQQGVYAFFAFRFLSKKSLVNDKTVKWVANRCCPSLDASSRVNPKRDPVHTWAFLPGEGTSSNDVITIRLLLKSLPNTVVFASSLLPAPWLVLGDTSYDKNRGARTRTIGQLCGCCCWAGGGEGWVVMGERGRGIGTTDRIQMLMMDVF